MDLNPALRRAVFLIRDALREFAKQKGWGPEDYRIFMLVDKKWRTFNVEFLSHSYDDIQTRSREEHSKALDEVMDFLESNFRDDIDLYHALRLSLGGLKSYGWYPDYDFGPSVEAIPDDILNPDAIDFRGDFRRKHGVS